MLTEEKLRKIFPEPTQVKRIFNEIQDLLRQMKEKSSYGLRITTIKNEKLNFIFTMLPKSFQDTDLSLDQKPVIKFSLSKGYPKEAPKAFFLHDSMILLSLRPCRNYLQAILASDQWSQKFTIAQVVKKVPIFLEKQSKLPEKEVKVGPPLFCEYFEIDTIFSWKFSQVYPVKLCKEEKIKQGIIVIIKMFSEVLIFEKVSSEELFFICDFFSANQIQSIRQNKKNEKILVELKLNYTSLKGNYCFEFSSPSSDQLVTNMIEMSKQKFSSTEFLQDSSSQSEEQLEKMEVYEGMSVNELHENITLYESMVESKITSQNIRQLIVLLQKAVEHYSAREDERFEIYLKKLRTMLNNKLVQVILESESEVVMKERKEAKHKSILDLF